MNIQPALRRETFSTSRLPDFCSERELIKQIGHAVDQWPLVATNDHASSQFQALGADANHHTVVQFHAAKANAKGKAANGATVDAG